MMKMKSRESEGENEEFKGRNAHLTVNVKGLGWDRPWLGKNQMRNVSFVLNIDDKAINGGKR
jgi:hypothetical protein